MASRPLRASTPAPLAVAIDRLVSIHGELRGALAALRRLHAHLTAGHGAAMAELFDEVEAVVGAHLAKEARVVVPYLRGLADGVRLPAPFAALDQPFAILARERRQLRDVAATLGARLAAIADACTACAVAYTTALALATSLSEHRTFVGDHLYPLALACEHQLGATP